MPGRYRVGASYANDLANGWSVKSATLAGRNALDFPIDVTVGGDAGGLEVTLTRATQRVSGVLLAGDGRPAPGVTIVLFPEDRALWRTAARIRTTRSGQDGQYLINDIRAGDYRLAAVADIAPGDANDPRVLDALVPAAIAVRVGSGQRVVQDLRVGR